MPRKAFIADLQDAVDNFHRVSILNLRAGGEEGLINFDYVQDGIVTNITVLVPDLGDYPDSHAYMIYTESDHVPKAVHEALDNMGTHSGMKVPKMLASVSRLLEKATLPQAGSRAKPLDLDGDHVMILDSDKESDPEDDEGTDADNDNAVDDDEEEEEEAWSPKPPEDGWNQNVSQPPNLSNMSNVSVLEERIRSDLSSAKNAGFRVSIQGPLREGGRQGFVTVSIRVKKLGISDEALQAWQMDSNQYFLLVIRYMNGYQNLDTVTGRAMAQASSLIAFRMGLHDKYKMEVSDLSAVFTLLDSKGCKFVGSADHVPKFGRLFIARPLDELLNERFLPLIRYRLAMGFPWRGAEEFFNDHQGRNLENDAPDTKYWTEDKSDKASSLPFVVTADHLTSHEKQKSLPLLAMQFALRHLVRCTEFCLVCHCKIEAEFEALKPYVCSKPLCLYQYMSLGFGPSIEHEILSQPLVVDLLVSFCYASASAQQLRHLPTGMALMVPEPTRRQKMDYIPGALPRHYPHENDIYGDQDADKERPKRLQGITYRAKFDPLSRDLLLHANERPPLQAGSWILFSPRGMISEESYHARVEAVLFPTVHLAKPNPEPRNRTNTMFSSGTASHLNSLARDSASSTTLSAALTTPATTPPINATNNTSSSSLFQDIEFTIYDRNFDELERSDQCRAICSLLDILPSAKAMKEYLLTRGGAEVSLRAWTERLSPATLGILRWIIASNRSCIVQVDDLCDGETSNRHSEERVSGMPGWLQFRLAQGAPDKEERFIQSIRQTTVESKHPTLFAWHGSPLHNWHGIVREGLHFERTSHGRAFGNGVYHALDVSTSLGYSGGPVYASANPNTEEALGTFHPGQWPHSQMKISQALTLNEIVNAPKQFVSSSPHLVVAQLDWIQSRYLFVMALGRDRLIEEKAPSKILDQDPLYRPLGSNRTKLVIPLNAISKSRRPSEKNPSTQTYGDKKRKIDEALDEANVLFTDESDDDDKKILLPSQKDEIGVARSGPTNLTPTSSKNETKSSFSSSSASATANLTDFTPGSHNYETLPLIEPPSYATPSTTRTLQRELKATLNTLDTHPSHELGWYIDRERVTNMYQWIIELHSFEPHLPLSKDLRNKSLKSVLIELRFGKEYPITPPFVRIIRPRFLSFMAGGGGHVTAGGALCMELLTNSGWSAVSNIESVLLQVRLALSSTDPKPARLDAGPVRDYGVSEAVEAYLRACRQHGWQVPADFQANYSGDSYSGGSSSI